MATVNYTNPDTDPTVRLFDEFYKRELVIDSNVYDTALSFFTNIFAPIIIVQLFLLVFLLNNYLSVLFFLRMSIY